jgi:hypothetical protein
MRGEGAERFASVMGANGTEAGCPGLNDNEGAALSFVKELLDLRLNIDPADQDYLTIWG